MKANPINGLGAILLNLLVLAVAGCGDRSAGQNADRIPVVTTVTQVSALVRAVGGDRISLTALLTSRDDPHQYELKPDQVKRLNSAQVIFASGAGADRWLDAGVRAAGTKTRVVVLSGSVKLRQGTGAEATGSDPHWWYDVDNAVAASAVISRALTEADPAHGADFQANAQALAQRLNETEQAIHALLDPVPAQKRLFVANHDAFNYFLARYSVTLVGDIVPSTDAVSAIRPADIAALVAAIRTLHVCAVFTETTIDPKLSAQIASEGHAKVYGGALYGDAIGDPGTEGATLEGALLHNAKLMAKAFLSC